METIVFNSLSKSKSYLSYWSYNHAREPLYQQAKPLALALRNLTLEHNTKINKELMIKMLAKMKCYYINNNTFTYNRCTNVINK